MRRGQKYDESSYQERTYAAKHRQAYLRVRSQAIEELVGALERDAGPLRILEIACGPGLSQCHLTRTRRQHLLVAIDRSEAMLRQSQANILAEGGTPRLVHATATRLPFASGTFDFVFATRFIHIFSDPAVVLDELRRVLRPGGTLAIEFYGRPYHLFIYLARRMNTPWRQFLWQYPTLKKARALMGGSPRLIALRLGGDRWVRRALGDRPVQLCLRHASHTPLQLFVAEYLAVQQPRHGL